MFYLPNYRPATFFGILFTGLLALLAAWLAAAPFAAANGISATMLAIVMGMVIGNTVRHRLPADWTPGIHYAGRMLLRAGVILYGFHITFQQIARVGAPGLAVDLLVMLLTFALAWWAGPRLFGLDHETSALIGTGASVCGAAAVIAAEGVVGNESHKTAVAVATVLLFGTVSMFSYPLLVHLGWAHVLPRSLLGIYFGATIHEVAQVVVAANAVPGIVATAVIVKMTRVLLLAPFLMMVSAFMRRRGAAGGKGRITVPWFAIWFVVAVGIRSTGIVPAAALGPIGSACGFLLAMAMGALGLETRVARMREAGAGAIGLAALLTVWLTFGGYFIVRGVGLVF